MADVMKHEEVKEYYGKVLSCSNDLKTNACRTACQKMPTNVKEALALIHDEVVSRYYGCGLIMPEKLEGASVLDLGCGSGRDCYLMSKLVGENGHVTGIDMTSEQVDIAKKYVEYHTERFGFQKPNIEFVEGYIEDMKAAQIRDNTYDICVSNCVVNLSPDKEAVLREAHRALKIGGEFYFSDVYADQQLPEEIRKNKILWGECIGGALFWEDLVKMAKETGFSTPRLVNASEIHLENKELQSILGNAKFVSATYRLFKLPPQLVSPCQVEYMGTIPDHEKSFEFDHRIHLNNSELVHVDAEVATILMLSRFKDDFKFVPYNMVYDSNPFKLSSKTDGLTYPNIELPSSAGAETNGSCCGATKRSCRTSPGGDDDQGNKKPCSANNTPGCC